MLSDKNKAAVQQFYQAFNQRNPALLDTIVQPDFVDHNPGPGQPAGLNGLKTVFASLQEAFPDLEIRIDGLLADDDYAATRLTARGTHTGGFMGMPPTERKVTFSAIDYYRLDAGRIVEAWHVEDWLGVMQQLGALPEPERQGL